MVVRSTLVRMSPGSQILRSAYWARESASLAGASRIGADVALLGDMAVQRRGQDLAADRAAGVTPTRVGIGRRRSPAPAPAASSWRAGQLRRPVELGIDDRRARRRRGASGPGSRRADALLGARTGGSGDSRRRPRRRRRRTARPSPSRAPARRPGRWRAPRRRRRARRRRRRACRSGRNRRRRRCGCDGWWRRARRPAAA